MQQSDKMNPGRPLTHHVVEEQFHNWVRGGGDERAREILDNFEVLFGEQVAASRRARGWSQRQLAEAVVQLAPDISLDSSAVTRIEAGKRSVSFKQAVAIAAALDEESAEMLVINAAIGDLAPNMFEWAQQIRDRVAELESEAAKLEAEYQFKLKQLRGHQEQYVGVRGTLTEEQRQALDATDPRVDG